MVCIYQMISRMGRVVQRIRLKTVLKCLCFMNNMTSEEVEQRA
jgi:hypothetical protein